LASQSPAGAASRAPAAAPVLTSAGQSPAAIGLNWTDTASTPFTNYTVEEASLASGWMFSVVTIITSQGTTSYVASGVSPGVQYAWQVTENYLTCFTVFCTPTSQTTNVLNLTQPSVAFLNDTAVTATGATLLWTNNASYGPLVSFDQYALYEEKNGQAPALLTMISTEATLRYVATLVSGASYTFYVETSDCAPGCAGSGAALSVTQSDLLTVGTPQPLSVTVFAQRTTINLGQPDYFTCTPTGGMSPFSYRWDFGNGTFVGGPASESVTLGALALQIVTCRVTDSQPSSASGAVDVQVNPALAVTASMNRTAVDVGQIVGFVCSVAGGTTPYGQSWSFGDGMSTTGNTPSHAYSGAGDYVPTCSVTDGAGVTAAPSLPLVVSPALDVSALASSTAAAPGTMLAFTAVASNGSGTYSAYTWSFGAGTPVSGADVTHAFTATGSASGTVRAVDSNGGTAARSVTVDVSRIAVVATPTPTSVSTGVGVKFNATASGGAGGPYNFTWRFGDGSTGYGPSTTHPYRATGTESPTLTVTDRLGATNATTLPSIAVSVAPTPFSWFTGWVALGIAIAIVAIILIVLLARRRSAESGELEKASSAYVPPTDPKKTIRGSKVCAFCGASNLPIRRTCSHCGKPLSRGTGP
jgi:PKD domain